MEARHASGWVSWLSSVPHKAVASAAVALAVVACGGGGGSGSIVSAPTGQRLAVSTTTATAVGTIADRYTVVNLGWNAWVDWWGGRQPINGSGQVAFHRYDPALSGYRAMLFDGSAIQDVSPAGGQDNRVAGVSNAGDVLGTTCCQPNWQPFVWRSGTTTMADPGWVYGVNSAGQAAVYSHLDSRPRVWTPATGSLIASPSFLNWAVPYAINNAGTVVGTGYDPNVGYRSFVWTPGVSGADVQWLNLPNSGSSADGQEINASSQVTGHYYNGSTYRAFRWSPGDATATELNVPRPGQSQAYDLNDLGQIVGYSMDGSYYWEPRAFVWTPASGGGGSATELTLAGSSWSYAYGVNDAGLVVGTDSSRAFAWTATQGVVDLNTRIPEASALGVYLYDAVAVSNNGAIVAHANTGLVLLQPGSVAIPTVGTIAANDPVPVNTALAFSAGFADADTSDTHTAVWSWGDGTADIAATISETNGTGTASASHGFAAAGVYTVSVEVTDNTGRSATVSREVVAYDPAAGFVTGGGWIQSPPGAYKENMSLAGRANFGFVSKYQKGATRPSGNTQFQFHAANLNFHSDNYDWLVVAGARAQYKGVGTINGQGEYKFLLTAVDGAKLGGGTPDRFRIKIWHFDAQTESDVTVYDNQLDSGAEGGNSEGTVIGGGSIVIHSK